MQLYKLNKLWIGLVTGIIFPILCFSIYWLLFQRHVKLESTDIKYLISQELMMNVFKICCGANLIFFYFGLNKNLISFAKGIIASVLIYALMFGYLTFF
jgi:hypothetical protein